MTAAPAGGPADHHDDERYAWHVVRVLMLVYVLNFLDRQIPSILAERIKADLGLTDAQVGFLYGTAFAVFYAIFGIPLGRLADVWNRTRLISIGLAVWSLMTTLSGLSQNFAHLALARLGVGVGEASAAPASYSMLADYFPAAKRATVLAVCQSGIFIGSGLGLGIGGLVVDRWDAAWAGTTAPFGLRGWQVAFFIVGLPGLLLALRVRRLREPMRGQSDGIFTAPEAHPWRAFLLELRAVLPPFTVLHLWLVGVGARTLATNLGAALLIAMAATGLTQLLGNPVQWIALGLGLYAAVSWMQALARRDRVCFALMFDTPSLRYAALGFSCLAAAGYGLTFWTPPFFIRVHGVDAAHAGLVLGTIHAAGGWLGVTLGGMLADRWRQRAPTGRLWLPALAATLPVPIAMCLLLTHDTLIAYALYFPLSVCSALWAGPAVSTIQEMVLPRMRATASAAYLLLVTFVGLALGPYAIGRLSVALGSLRAAMLLGLTADALALAFVLLGMRQLARDESSLLHRARAAGESIG